MRALPTIITAATIATLSVNPLVAQDTHRNHWIEPKLPTPKVLTENTARPPSKRFGINASKPTLASELAKLGIGRVRFENLKWPMVSKAHGTFAFDGSVAPWYVQHDKIMAGYHAAGLDVLPFLFQTAAHASSAPDGTKPHRLSSYPPKDDSGYAHFVWQTVARYGNENHPRSKLKTADGQSGMGLINGFELWNEPNLNDPHWGPWVSDLPRYFKMFRAGSEAAKKADPNALVAHGGFAGIDIDTVDQLASFRYPDGKSPLEFTDIINVHYYSGKTRPEKASIDPNVERRADATGGLRTYEDDLRRLRDWRDQFCPDKPIWMTETGYDTAGPYGITEREQAARLPRCVMLALAEGCESVFVYRESGSKPSQHAASGLLRDDGSRKPSWQSYTTLVSKLGDCAAGYQLAGDKNLRAFIWKRSNDESYVVATWAVEGRTSFPEELGSCTVTDAFGSTSTIPSTARLALSEFPVYLTGFEDGAKAAKVFAAAVASEKDRKELRRQDSDRQAYLFDFGGDSKVKTYELGNFRRFTPVTKTDLFEGDQKFGFTPRPAMQDGYRKWIRDFAECDECRISKDIRFRFDIEAGRYALAINGKTLSKDPVKLRVISDEKLVGELIFKDEATAELEFPVNASTLTLEADGYLDLRWLRAVETPNH